MRGWSSLSLEERRDALRSYFAPGPYLEMLIREPGWVVAMAVNDASFEDPDYTKIGTLPAPAWGE